jgi:hypothetical protein
MNQYDPGIGVDIGFSKTQHQASQTIWPTIIRDGKFELLESWQSAL